MTRQTIRVIIEGKYAAEVAIDLIEDETGWSPYVSFDDATRVVEARRALKRGDIAGAAKHGKVYELLPLSA
jgi:hypothetical protein